MSEDCQEEQTKNVNKINSKVAKQKGGTAE